MLISSAHLEKAYSSMEVTESGILFIENDAHFEKANNSIDFNGDEISFYFCALKVNHES